MAPASHRHGIAGTWLKRYLPGYAKGIGGRNDPRDRIDAAIRRARLRDDPRYADRQRALGGATAYRLVETMLRI